MHRKKSAVFRTTIKILWMIDFKPLEQTTYLIQNGLRYEETIEIYNYRTNTLYAMDNWTMVNGVWWSISKFTTLTGLFNIVYIWSVIRL